MEIRSSIDKGTSITKKRRFTYKIGTKKEERPWTDFNCEMEMRWQVVSDYNSANIGHTKMIHPFSELPAQGPYSQHCVVIALQHLVPSKMSVLRLRERKEIHHQGSLAMSGWMCLLK